MPSILRRISDERRRQRERFGTTDDEYIEHELVFSAISHCLPENVELFTRQPIKNGCSGFHPVSNVWREARRSSESPVHTTPYEWETTPRAPTYKDRYHDLIVAATFIVAELERMERAHQKDGDAQTDTTPVDPTPRNLRGITDTIISNNIQRSTYALRPREFSPIRQIANEHSAPVPPYRGHANTSVNGHSAYLTANSPMREISIVDRNAVALILARTAPGAPLAGTGSAIFHTYPQFEEMVFFRHPFAEHIEVLATPRNTPLDTTLTAGPTISQNGVRSQTMYSYRGPYQSLLERIVDYPQAPTPLTEAQLNGTPTGPITEWIAEQPHTIEIDESADGAHSETSGGEGPFLTSESGWI